MATRADVPNSAFDRKETALSQNDRMCLSRVQMDARRDENIHGNVTMPTTTSRSYRYWASEPSDQTMGTTRSRELL